MSTTSRLGKIVVVDTGDILVLIVTSSATHESQYAGARPWVDVLPSIDVARGWSSGVQSVNTPWSRAAVSVFSSRHAIVIGPVPPGIGVMWPATSATGA